MVGRGAYRKPEAVTGGRAVKCRHWCCPTRGLLVVNLDGCVLLNIMITFAGENRELEAGDGN